MKASIFIIFIILTIVEIKAQITFQKNLGSSSSNANSVLQTNDDGYLIAGRISGKMYIVRTNEYGDTIWTKLFSGISYAIASQINNTSDGGYIIIGTTYQTSIDTSDIYLVKIDFNGQTIWSKIYGGLNNEIGKSVQQSNDGGYVLLGTINDFSSNKNILFIKTDALGDTIWTKNIGGSNNEDGSFIQQTNDNGYIITGIINNNSPTDDNIYLTKTDSTGIIIWSKIFGGQFNDRGNTVRQTSDLGYVIIGSTKSYNNNTSSIYLIKTDVNGDSLWTKYYAGFSSMFGNFTMGNDIQETNDYGFIIASYGKPNLVKVNQFGDTLWTKTFLGNGSVTGSNAEFIANSVQITSDNGYILTGDFISSAGEIDIGLIKTDEYGVILSSQIVRANSLITIFPNPVKNKLYIHSNTEGLNAFVLLNSLGQELYTEKISEKMEIDFGCMPNGLYIIRYISNDRIETFKIIKTE